MSNFSENRNTIVIGDVNHELSKSVIEQILKINHEDSEKEKKVVDYKREPIKIILSSFGGSVYDGLAIYDVMRCSKTPIHTYGYGFIMSMGVGILLGGSKRFLSKNSSVMIHDMSVGSFGTLENVKEYTKVMDNLRDLAEDIILDRTNIMKSQLDDIYEKKKDWYITSDEAVKLGIVHEILKYHEES